MKQIKKSTPANWWTKIFRASTL